MGCACELDQTAPRTLYHRTDQGHYIPTLAIDTLNERKIESPIKLIVWNLPRIHEPHSMRANPLHELKHLRWESIEDFV